MFDVGWTSQSVCRKMTSSFQSYFYATKPLYSSLPLFPLLWCLQGPFPTFPLPSEPVSLSLSLSLSLPLSTRVSDMRGTNSFLPVLLYTHIQNTHSLVGKGVWGVRRELRNRRWRKEKGGEGWRGRSLVTTGHVKRRNTDRVHLNSKLGMGREVGVGGGESSHRERKRREGS